MSQPQAIERVLDALRDRGVIAADAPPPPLDADHRPWFVALMLGFAGWLAGIFLLAFTGVMLDLDSMGGRLFAGVLFLGGAWALYYADRNAVFLDQLALAVSIAGQCALAWALLDDVRSLFGIAATLFVLQLAVLAIMPNRTARTLAALFAALAWIYAVRFAVHPGRGASLFFGSAERLAGAGDETLILAWLFTWVPLICLTAWLVRHEARWMTGSFRHYARPILAGVLLALAAGGLATEPFMMLAFGMEGIGVGFSWQAVFPLLSIALALFAAWCAFRMRSAGLTGFAIVAALAHLGRFYYLYGTSLLWKSLIMLCLGMVLLGVGVLMGGRPDRPGRST